MMISLVGLVVSWSVALAPPAETLGTFELDPVALIDRGEEIPGDPGLRVEHEQFVYLFADRASMEAFEANPSRYEVRQGGACARMGALSGVGRPALWTVHDGALYFAASEGCLAWVEKSPELVLDRDDEAPEGGPDAVARGRELMERSLAWVGGREALSRVRGVALSQSRVVEREDGDLVHSVDVTLGLPGLYRKDTGWGEDRWVVVASEAEGYFDDRGERLRIMDLEQRRTSMRDMARIPAVFMDAYVRGAVTPVALGRDAALGGERVAFVLYGRRVELVIDPESGELVAQRFRGRGGESGLLGTVERRFVHGEPVGGLRLPAAWEQWFDGERDADRDVAPGRVAVRLNPPIEPGFFGMPGG